MSRADRRAERGLRPKPHPAGRERNAGRRLMVLIAVAGLLALVVSSFSVVGTAGPSPSASPSRDASAGTAGSANPSIPGPSAIASSPLTSPSTIP